MGLQVSQKCPLHSGQEMTFEDGDTDRPGSALVGDQHKMAVCSALEGHLRHNRHTKTGAHHGQNAAELAALKNHTRHNAGMLANLDSSFPEAMIVAEKQERFVAQLFQYQT